MYQSHLNISVKSYQLKDRYDQFGLKKRSSYIERHNENGKVKGKKQLLSKNNQKHYCGS